jgi:hypothetical protein
MIKNVIYIDKWQTYYKQVIIEYYDDLIAQLDVHAELTLDKFKDDKEEKND